jgi:hypothetical protein
MAEKSLLTNILRIAFVKDIRGKGRRSSFCVLFLKKGTVWLWLDLSSMKGSSTV